MLRREGGKGVIGSKVLESSPNPLIDLNPKLYLKLQMSEFWTKNDHVQILMQAFQAAAIRLALLYIFVKSCFGKQKCEFLINDSSL